MRTTTSARARPAVTPEPEPVPAWARELIETTRRLCDLLERQAQRADVWRGPRDDFDVAVVIALRDAVKALGFTAAQIFSHVRVAHPALAAALVAADITSPAELGALLARLEGLRIGEI